MKGNERLIKILELQNKNIKIEDIAKEIGITVKTLRNFLNKNGYKFKDGKYELNIETKSKKENQMSFEQIEDKSSSKNVNTKKNSIKENIKKDNPKVGKNTKKESKANIESKLKATKATKAKKDKRINITQDDLDKICEVYDWYLQVKDYKSMKPKSTSSKKDVVIENKEIKDIKTTSIRVEKRTWEDFERLCTNSDFSKQEILTQALKDFMKQYKNLL